MASKMMENSRQYPKTTTSVPLHLVGFNCMPLNVIIILLTITGGAITVFLNSTIFKYHKSRHDCILNKIFMFLASIDTLMGFASLHHGITLFFMTLNCGKAVQLVLPLTAMLSSVSTHVSTFYNVLLAVTRTTIILSPFCTFNRPLIYLVAFLYPLFWSAMSVYEIYSVHVMYSNYTIDHVDMLMLSPMTGSELIYNVSNNNAPNYVYFILLLGIPFVVPSVIGLACCVMTLAALKRSCSKVKKVPSDSFDGSMTRATITVVLLTAVFFICNSLFFAIEYSLQTFGTADVFPYEMYIVYFSGNILPFINSLVNPLILIYRGSMLQAYLREIIRSRSTENYIFRTTMSFIRCRLTFTRHAVNANP